jgi:alanyl-tRNA synthetase
MQGINDIRSAFLNYFQRHGHEIVASGPLVPRNDPTLMFTNAGMVQFKNVFTGLEKRPYSRAVTSQKCVRAGGKHNDLDNVGYTARHHTFFEMLGNFSFGDYFKAEAIELAWNLITKEFGLPHDRLLTTVYAEDDEAFDLWRKIAGLPESRIIRIPTSDNFWAMGDTGPCGPCSEIFFDHGEEIAGGPPGSADEDGDRFIEIWNLVFMQFEQLSADERVDLPRPSIDTGMGLERIAAVLQGVHDNYDIDLFRALIAASEEATGVPAQGEHRASHRVIADHLRASSFLIADGVLPSNEGRGYVLRRIMRRAMRHASLLGAREPLMYRLFPTLLREMGAAYPELGRADALITETLLLEETRFRKTLERGLGLLGEATKGLGEGDELDGETAFKLYDTYGFPLDLTQDALKKEGISVDVDGFNTAMERQKAEARASWAGSGEAADDKVWFAIRERVGATEFLGYDTELAQGVVQAIVRDGAEHQIAHPGETVMVVVNQTPFYAESGGQIGDRGEIRFDGGRVKITDTRKMGEGLHVHFGEVEGGDLAVGGEVELEIDHAARAGLRRHHSATHLVHEALRETLGRHVAQKGSLVAPDRLRFDFSHPKPMTAQEIADVETMANAVIQQSAPVETRIMEVDDAIAAGAMALFGEKYGDEVRVVSMGRATSGEKQGKTYSLELCGGTHVANTGEIGLVHLLGESAVSAGVRRIEALTGAAALDYFEAQEQRLREIAGLLKVPPAEAVARVEALVEERRRLERELAETRRQLAMGGPSGDDTPMREIKGVRFMAKIAAGVPPKELKGLADAAKDRLGSGIAAVISTSEDGKAAVVVGVTDDLTDRYNAVDLVRIASQALGGKGGGGRPDMAQAGGPHGDRAEAAVEAIEAALAG